MPSNSQIPADFQEEILHLLPSNDLLNYKRVSKHWNELISSQRFIQKHLHRSKSAGTLIVTLSWWGIIVYDDPTGNKIRIPYPSGFSLNNTKIAGSCNGLVCLIRKHKNDFVLFNPSTGKCRVRRADRFFFTALECNYWFGQHLSTGEYLIIAIGMQKTIQIYQISSAPPFWKHISIRRIFRRIDTKLILLHGALHWCGYEEPRDELRAMVLAYDIQETKLREIGLPFGTFSDVRLGTVDGCLFAIISNAAKGLELWVMREYGVEESWTKYCDIEGFEAGGRVPSPLGFVADGDLVLNIVGCKKIVKYSFSDKKVTLLDVYRVHCGGYSETDRTVLCADSLVSPSLIWE